MSQDDKKAPSMELEISVDGGSRAAADFSNPDKPSVIEGEDEGTTLEFNRDGTVVNRSVALDAEAEGEGDETSADDTTLTEEGGEEAPADLPDYEAGNEEVHKAYEGRFYTFGEDGAGDLNLAAFEEVYEKNDKSLPEGVYGFLKEAVGISREGVDEIIAGREALKEQANQEVYSGFGGKEVYEAAFEWATGETAGYTQEQRDRYNAAMQSDDPAARKEALELLKTRFEAASGKGTPSAPARRRASPSRIATGSTTPASSGPAPYADNKEYLADAKAKGATNPEVRARLAASSFYLNR